MPSLGTTFDATPQTFRYLKGIVEMYNEFFSTPEKPFVIKNYLDDEQPTDLSECNRIAFWHYLEAAGAIELITDETSQILALAEYLDGRNLVFPANTKFLVLNIEILKALLNDAAVEIGPLPPGTVMKFNDETGAITLGKKKIPLPPHRDEHCFLRIMMQNEVNIPVSWDIIYEAMTNEVPERRNLKKVYDTMVRINGRTKQTCGVKVFAWQGKTIKRNF